MHWHCTGWCTANVYTVCRKGADTNSCVWTAEERGRVMDQLMLWDFVLEERLGEMEAWSVLCQGCHLLSEKLNTIEDTTGLGDQYEQFIVTARRLELSEGGLVLSTRRKIYAVLDYLPPKMKPLLDLTFTDLGRVGVFSLAKLVLANIANIKSRPLYQLLSSSLQTNINAVPDIKDVLQTCLNVISVESSKRIISSMYFKHMGRCKKEYGARNFSTIRSLPSLPLQTNLDDPESPPPERRLQTFLSDRNLRREPTCAESEENRKRISGVCDYIRLSEERKAEDVFGLLDLPGLKYNRNSKASLENVNNNQNIVQPHQHSPAYMNINLTKNTSEGQTVKIALLDEQLLHVHLMAKEVIIDELLKITLDKLNIDRSDLHFFCLCKKLRNEYFYLNTTESVAHHLQSGTDRTFHLRLIKPPSINLRKIYSKQLMKSNNFGTFRFTGAASKLERSVTRVFEVDVYGMKVDGSFTAWKNIKQVSFSHSYLQILSQEGENCQKTKISFSSGKTKMIYDLVLFLVNSNKEVEKSKEKELSNLDDLCDQLMKITKTAIKVISTPQRKRTKSTDPELSKSAKKQKLTQPLNFSERKKNKPPVPQYQYKLYLENEEDDIYVHVDHLRRCQEKENIPKKTRISTNPKVKADATQKSVPLAPRHGPVITMGTTTLKRKLTNNFETDTAKKIACVSMSKLEYLSLNINLRKSDEGVFIDETNNRMKKKLQRGDKIVAVNGKILENCSLEKSKFVIANSGHLLNFILQR